MLGRALFFTMPIDVNVTLPKQKHLTSYLGTLWPSRIDTES